jgi:DNA-binding transcriptional ArsR family regulator
MQLSGGQMDKNSISTLNENTATRLAELFASLSDPTRVRILGVLMVGEVNVGDLVQLMGLSKSTISHQLRILRDRQVIRTRKQGRQVFIALDDDHIGELFQRGLDHIVHG